jgi:hypothetical protein
VMGFELHEGGSGVSLCCLVQYKKMCATFFVYLSRWKGCMDSQFWIRSDYQEGFYRISRHQVSGAWEV